MASSVPCGVLDEARERSKREIPADALVPDDVLEQLKVFTPHDLPKPPTLRMPDYTEAQMPTPARKLVDKHLVVVPPTRLTYEQCLDSLRKHTYMSLYKTHLPMYNDNLRYKTASPSFCHALQTILNEKYARHLQLCVLYDNRNRLLEAHKKRKLYESEDFVDDDEVVQEVLDESQAATAKAEAEEDDEDVEDEDGVDNLFGSEDEDAQSQSVDHPVCDEFEPDALEEYDEDDFFKG